MAKDDFRCAHRLRVRWAEVDMQKVVFNGHYLTYIDTAIADYWREIGVDYPEGYLARYANDVFLRKATVEYLGSARYDDELAVYCRVARLGRSSMTYAFEIWRERPDASAAALVAAELVYVNADPKTMKAAPLPEELRARVRAYERAAPAEG
ncbi:MAG TPA: thioesterase family protein [Burkholderiales bacterium]|nr:thioesterase family protein [Burkholderiales bacterium]